MALAAPPPYATNPFAALLADYRAERAATTSYPPGPTRFSLRRTRAFNFHPLPLLLDLYAEHGPIFSLRVLHAQVVFMLGPEANHYVTVSHAHNFRWRDGSMGDLIPLLGDGLLTTDGEIHKRARHIMLPAFHRDRILAAGEAMLDEAGAAVDGLRADQWLDLYAWARGLAMRIALRALFGFDPRHESAASDFERGLAYYSRDYVVQMLRGPGTPYAQMQAARGRLNRLIDAEVAARRARPEPGEDLLGLLLSARDEEGELLDRAQIRDQVMTLMFAGHDTTTSTVTFLFYELARHPRVADRLVAEIDETFGDGAPTPEQIATGLPELEMALDETLRLYPAAWVGPRRSVEPFEFAGHDVPGATRVHYSSWASHRLPDVFPDPDAFLPERFAPEAKARLPKGAYVPFGGGSRTCIGMRFGQLEIKTIAALILRSWRLELVPGREMSVRQMPTLGPRGGLPVIVRERRAAPA